MQDKNEQVKKLSSLMTDHAHFRCSLDAIFNTILLNRIFDVIQLEPVKISRTIPNLHYFTIGREDAKSLSDTIKILTHQIKKSQIKTGEILLKLTDNGEGKIKSSVEETFSQDARGIKEYGDYIETWIVPFEIIDASSVNSIKRITENIDNYLRREILTICSLAV